MSGTRTAGRATGLALLALLLLVAGADPGAAQLRTLEPVGAADREALFTTIASVARLDDGRLFVADGGEERIVVLDPDGFLLGVLGGEGQGPGEFQSLRGVWRIGPDSVAAWDSRARRVTVFDARGEVARTVRVAVPAEVPQNLDALVGGMPDGGFVLATIEVGPEGAGGLRPDHLTFERFDRDGNWLRTLGRDFGFLRASARGVGGPHPFSPYPWGATHEGRVVFTNGFDPEFRTFEEGVGGRVIETSFEVPYDPVRLDVAWSSVDGMVPEGSPMGRLAAAMDRTAGTVPALGRMFVAESGEVWVKSWDPRLDAMPVRVGRFTPGGEWIRVDGNGTVIDRVAVPPDFAPIRADRELVIGIRWLPYDEQTLEWMWLGGG